MKKAFFSTDIIIKTKRNFTLNEVYAIMKENLEEKFGLIVMKKELKLFDTIFVQGVDNYVNKVSVSHKQIIISQDRITKGIFDITASEFAGSLLSAATGEISEAVGGVLNIGGTKGNKALMKMLGEEIEKLVNAV